MLTLSKIVKEELPDNYLIILLAIFATAFQTDPEFFDFYRAMQAYTESLKNDDTTMILSHESDFFRYFGNSQGKAKN